MPKITIKVTDMTTTQLRALDASLRGGALIERLGMGLKESLQSHFKDRDLSSSSDSKRAARGMPQYGIWGKIRGSTTYVGTAGNAATVGVSEPAFRAKLFGLRDMTARRSKYLAIPLDPRTYGKRAGEKPVTGMFKWTNKKTGKSYLAVKEGTGIKVLYRLMDSVTVPADPRALPTDEKVFEASSRVISRWLAKIKEGQQ